MSTSEFKQVGLAIIEKIKVLANIDINDVEAIKRCQVGSLPTGNPTDANKVWLILGGLIDFAKQYQNPPGGHPHSGIQRELQARCAAVEKQLRELPG